MNLEQRTDPFNDGITKEMIQDAKATGFSSFFKGVSFDENPYPHGNKQWTAWREGFSEAEEHYRDER